MCYLLQIDDFNILLDCGWDERYDENMLAPLKNVVADIDAVLLSHPDLAHLGALPYAVGKLGLNCPVYCTLPVWKMGQMFLYDAYQTMSAYDFNGFTLDDVDAAFDKCKQLKYSQETLIVADKGSGELKISLTPYNAGHMLGGTLWRIINDTHDIVYAVDFNHKRERHLNASVLEALGVRPSLLITDARNVFNVQKPRKDRDRELFESIGSTLKSGGCALLPVDSAGRVLELLMMIHQYWETMKIGKDQYRFVFLSHESYNTVDFARGQIEWMSSSCIKLFDTHRDNPFSLRHLTICHTKEELDRIPKPYVVLASSASLSSGLSQDVFLDLCREELNRVILTTNNEAWSLSAKLMKLIQTPTPSSSPSLQGSKIVRFLRRRNVLLKGRELDEYLEQQRIQIEQKALEGAVDEDESEDDEDEEMEADLQDIGVTRRKIRRKPQFPMFAPYDEPPVRKWDAYGEIVKADDIKQLAEPNVKLIERDGQTMAVPSAFPTTIASDSFLPSEDDATITFSRSSSTSILSSSTLSSSSMMFQQRAQQKMRKQGGEGEGEDSIMQPKEQVVERERPPRKTILEPVEVEVRCGVQFIDLEGRSDGRSIKNIIAHLQPRKLVLVHGSDEAKTHLKNYLAQHKVKEVLVPKNNQLIDISADTNVYSVSLRDSLLQSLEFVKLGDYEVAYAEGELHIDYKESPLPMLKPSTQAKGHPAVFLGDMKFADLKRILNQAGIAADFYGGILVCAGGAVNIRKIPPAQISIQGALCEEYFQIRSLLYDQYHIV